MISLAGLRDLVKTTRADGLAIHEGYLPLSGTLSGFSTYVRIVGDVASDKVPLVLLHGGPGSTHNSFEVLDDLGKLCPVVMYDQIGCGKSLVLGHDELWHMDTWVLEFEELVSALRISRMHLLGQSFGGMLLLSFALAHLELLQSIILSSTLACSALWAKEGHLLAQTLDAKYRDALMAAEAQADFSGDAYLEALDVYMNTYCYDTHNPHLPECVTRKRPEGSSCYEVAWGPNELCATGTLKDFDVRERLCELDVPALVLNGEHDLSTAAISDGMADLLPNALRHTFKGARHVCYVQATEAYKELLSTWLEQNTI